MLNKIICLSVCLSCYDNLETTGAGGKLGMKSLKTQLQECYRKTKSTRSILGKYGVQREEDIKKPSGYLNQEQAMIQVMNWITWQLKINEQTKIRLIELNTKNVYTVIIKHVPRRGLLIEEIVDEPKLRGKALHHWSAFVTYETLSLFEIRASIECADALNNFNDDVLQRKIDELVDEAIQLKILNGCTCDCCNFV